MNGESAPLPQGDGLPPIPPLEKKKGISNGCMVAVVIAVLLGGAFVFNPGGHGRWGYRILKTKAWMKGLEIAIKGYKTEYLRFPNSNPLTPMPDNSAYETNSGEGKELIDILLDAAGKENPRHIRFWEPPPSKADGSGYTSAGGLVDPFGKQPFRMVLDYSKDGLIDDPEGGSPIKADVIIYSAGPDGDFSTWQDNVRSWK